MPFNEILNQGGPQCRFKYLLILQGHYLNDDSVYCVKTLKGSSYVFENRLKAKINLNTTFTPVKYYGKSTVTVLNGKL